MSSYVACSSSSSSLNPIVNALLTDMYQLRMAYAHWIHKRHDEHAVFDLFFRKNPFLGEYCIFAGLDEVLAFLDTYKFTEDDVIYLKSIMPDCNSGFFDWLLHIDYKQLKVYSIEQGTVVFPREPLIRVEGPLAVGQLIETTLLNLVNFPSLIATNAARMRIAAGPSKCLLEFGLRRAQGPDGALSASKYSYLGGFDGTSNVLAGKLNSDIQVKGTHAHAYVMSYTSLDDLKTSTIVDPYDSTKVIEFKELVLSMRELIYPILAAAGNDGELAAFISYAQAVPNGLIALVDTYDTIHSGIPNFLCVAAALVKIGYKPVGIRLDSGDLAYLSKTARTYFKKIDKLFNTVDIYSKLQIVASNDLKEDVLLSLNIEGHEIDTFGIGTNLVTCYDQPALGCVYKLVEINGIPRIKLSQDLEKIVIPCKKNVYRLYGIDGSPLLDYMQMTDEEAPVVGQKILCRHPFHANKRAYATPSKVQPLLQLVYDGEVGIVKNAATLNQAREACQQQMKQLRQDHVRSLNPTPYKVSLSQRLYDFMHQLWLDSAPVADII